MAITGVKGGIDPEGGVIDPGPVIVHDTGVAGAPVTSGLIVSVPPSQIV